MNQNEAPKRISIRLEPDQFDKKGKRESLGELLSKAIEVTEYGRSMPYPEIWLSRWAIRAVCNAIIAEGEAEFPLEVDLRKPQHGFGKQPMSVPDVKSSAVETEQIEIRVPKVFLRLCEQYYKLDAARLADALIYDFTLNPPKELTLVKRATQATDDSDDQGEEWKDTGR